MLQFAVYADNLHTTTTFLQQVAGLSERDFERFQYSYGADLTQVKGVRSIFSLAENNKEEVIKRIIDHGGIVISSDDRDHQWIVSSTTENGTIIGFMFD
jgi:hypothetical protein